MPVSFLDVDQFLDLGDHPLGADVVGQRGDDQALAARRDVLDRRGGPHLEGAAAGAVGVVDAAQAVDVAAGRQVGTRDEVHQVVERRVGVLEQVPGGGHDLDQVVGRHVGRHADRDAGRAVDQQVGERRPQDRGLGLLAVVVGLEVDRVLVDRLHHQHRRVGQAGLGVAHGGRAGRRASRSCRGRRPAAAAWRTAGPGGPARRRSRRRRGGGACP